MEPGPAPPSVTTEKEPRFRRCTMRADEVMTTNVVTVGPNATVKEVARLLVARGINAVPVVDPQGRLVGIVSERDLIPLETHEDPLRHALPVQNGEGNGNVPKAVEEVMSKDVIALPPDADIADLARLMLDHRIKQIPIVRGSRVVGIVTRRDVLKVLARTDSEIHLELENLLDDEVRIIGEYRAEVSGGVATLRGPVDEDGRRLVRALARSVPGVIGIRFEDPS
jgi:CBS domain-containing protein